ncbi:hypothetical protein KP509_21G005600 [Ceratopteris richardii]|uniref:NAD(P)-binding domain-containing protein n=1 Tax=Ceratopteris richardii TaxID=49495 RepID=A0A8T2SAH0_CERRI|nr:hypothetical protein KP509_21G005600 [Ceratopteris richardii]
MASSDVTGRLLSAGALRDDRNLFTKHNTYRVGISPVQGRRRLAPSRRIGQLTARCLASSISPTSSSSSMLSFPSGDESAQSTKCVLVVGATGGVGQLVVAALIDRGYKTCVVVRDTNKAASVFGETNMDKMQVFVGDTRNMGGIEPAAWEGVTHVICCTGTTAFPSKRWDGDNTPENTDWHGVRNLIDSVPKSVQRFVLVSSVGVTKFNQLPWNIMNLFGVLKYKKMGEEYLCKSGIPFTIIRAGRLTDGPYTSYDLNTLLKATAGTRRCVVLGQGDKLVGEVSRIVVAEACIQALDIQCTCGNIYEINSVEGDGPGTDNKKWEILFTEACPS